MVLLIGILGICLILISILCKFIGVGWSVAFLVIGIVMSVSSFIKLIFCSLKVSNDTSLYNDEIRSKMETGDVIVFQGKELFFSKFIQWGTQSPYSHVGIILRIEDQSNLNSAIKYNRVFIIESTTDRGLTLLPLSRKLQSVNAHVWFLKLSSEKVKKFTSSGIDMDVMRGKIKGWTMNEIGKPYDFQDIIQIVFLILSSFKMKIKKSSYDKYICSAFVAAAFEVAGLPLIRQANCLSPKDIAELKFLDDPKQIL